MDYSYKKQSISNVYENLSKVKNCEFECNFCQILSRQSVSMDLTGSYPATTLWCTLHITSILFVTTLLIIPCVERLQCRHLTKTVIGSVGCYKNTFRFFNVQPSGKKGIVRFMDQRYLGISCVDYKTMVDYLTASNILAFICSLRMSGISCSFVHDADGHLTFRHRSVKPEFNVKCLKKDEFGIGW